MSRRSIFTLSAIAALGLALLPSIIAAQQRTLKEQLVGTWAFVSCDSTTATGAKVPLCAAPADGILTLDASEWSASVITRVAAPNSPPPTARLHRRTKSKQRR